jgi:hypothetical protein
MIAFLGRIRRWFYTNDNAFVKVVTRRNGTG